MNYIPLLSSFSITCLRLLFPPFLCRRLPSSSCSAVHMQVAAGRQNQSPLTSQRDPYRNLEVLSSTVQNTGRSRSSPSLASSLSRTSVLPQSLALSPAIILPRKWRQVSSFLERKFQQYWFSFQFGFERGRGKITFVGGGPTVPWAGSEGNDIGSLSTIVTSIWAKYGYL